MSTIHTINDENTLEDLALCHVCGQDAFWTDDPSGLICGICAAPQMEVASHFSLNLINRFQPIDLHDFESNYPIHEKCKGCRYVKQEYLVSVCQNSINPSYWWKFAGCPLKTGVSTLTGN